MKKILHTLILWGLLCLPQTAAAYYISVYNNNIGYSEGFEFTQVEGSTTLYEAVIAISNWNGDISSYSYWIGNNGTVWDNANSVNAKLDVSDCTSGRFYLTIDISEAGNGNNFAPSNFTALENPCAYDTTTGDDIEAGTVIFFNNTNNLFTDGIYVAVSSGSSSNASLRIPSTSYSPSADAWYTMSETSDPGIWRVTITSAVSNARVSFWSKDMSAYQNLYDAYGFFNIPFNSTYTQYSAASVSTTIDDLNSWCYYSPQKMYYATSGEWEQQPVEVSISTDRTYITPGEITSYTLTATSTVKADSYLWEYSLNGEEWVSFKTTTTSVLTVEEADFINESAYYRVNVVFDGATTECSNTCYVGFPLNCSGGYSSIVVYEQNFGTVSSYKDRMPLDGMQGYTYLAYPKSINDGYYALVADPYYCGCGNGSNGATPDVTTCMPAERDTCERSADAGCSTWFRGYTYPAKNGVKLRDHTLAEQSDNASEYGLSLFINYKGDKDTLAYMHELDADEAAKMLPGSKVRLLTYVASPAKTGSGSISTSVTMGIAIEFKGVNDTEWTTLRYVNKTVYHDDNWTALVTPDFTLGSDEGSYRIKIYSSSEGGAEQLGNDVLIDDILLEACQPKIEIYYENEDGTTSMRKTMAKENDEFTVVVPEFEAAVLGENPCVMLFWYDSISSTDISYKYIATMETTTTASGELKYVSKVSKNFVDFYGVTTELFEGVPDSTYFVAIATISSNCSGTAKKDFIDGVEGGSIKPKEDVSCFITDDHLVLKTECYGPPSIEVDDIGTQLCLKENFDYPSIIMTFESFCDTVNYTLYQNDVAIVENVKITDDERDAGKAVIDLALYEDVLNWQVDNHYVIKVHITETYNKKIVCEREAPDELTIYVYPYPDIVAQLEAATLCSGSSHTFSVDASNVNTYRWESSTDGGTTWTEVGTEATYTVASATSSTDLYRVAVAYTAASGRVCGYETSNAVSLSIVEYPDQTETLSDITRCKGSEGPTLSNPYTGSTNTLWEYRTSSTGTWIEAATTDDYTIPASHTSGYQYRVTATNTESVSGVSCSKGASAEVTLTELQIPIVATINDPVMCPGQTDATIEAEVSGDFNSAQWYCSTDGGSTWSAVGTNDAVYTLPADAQTGWKYKVEVSNILNGVTCSNGESNVVTLTVQTMTASITAGTNFLTCSSPCTDLSASADFESTYVWYRNDETIGEGETINVCSDGTYKVVATTAAGCTAQNSIDITQDTNIPTLTITKDHEKLTCDTLAIKLTAVTNASNPTYEWSNSDNTQMITITEAATYNVTITDGTTGCETSSSVLIEIDNVKPELSIEAPYTELTCTNPSVTLTAVASNVSYLWNTGETISEKPANAAGQYSVTVKSLSNGCENTKPITITENKIAPSITISGAEVLTCSITSITLTANVTEATPNVSYAWTNSADESVGSEASIPVNTADTYKVVVTNTDNGCEANKSETINQSADVPSVTISGAETLTCATTSVTLSANVTGATNVSYVWKNSAGESLGSAQTQVITDPDTYTVLVTNTDNGCSSESSVEISEDKTTPEAAINANPTELTCTTTSITLTAQTNADDASYLWSTNETTQAISVSAAGTYTVKITDNSNGCSAEAQQEITQNIKQPDIAITKDKEQFTCNISEITLTSSADNATNPTYKWNDGTEGETLLITFAGTYSVTVTDGYNGCSDSKDITIGEDKTAPSITITGAAVLTCDVESVTLTANVTDATPNVSYLWSTGETTQSIEVTAAGTYTVTVTNTDNGCEADKSETITQSADKPSVTISGAETLTCATTSVTLSANVTGATNVSYVWKNSAGESLGSAQTQVITDPDTYKVVVTNTDNGCSAEASVTITENIENPEASISADPTELTCTTTSITLTAQTNAADASYLWSTGETTQVVSVSTADTYKVTITDNSNGCTAEATKEITQNIVKPDIVITKSKVQFTCDTTEITLTASADNATNPTYKWNDGTEGENLTIQASGTYSVTVTDGHNGCSDSKDITIGEDKTAPTITISGAEVLTCSTTEITLTAEVSDATPNVKYAWTRSDGTEAGAEASIPVNTADTYKVVVTNTDNGCEADKSETINQSADVPSVTISGAETLTCATTSVTLSANVTGATNVSYAWTKSDGTEMGSGQTQVITEPDTYKVVVTNTDNGCSSEDSETIDQNIEPPDIKVSQDYQKLTCDTLAIKLTATSGTANPIYKWSDGINVTEDAVLTVTSPGTYTITVSEGNTACYATQNVVIDQDITEPSFTISGAEVLTCSTTEITLTAEVSDATPNVKYAWTRSDGTEAGAEASIPVNTADTYKVVVTNTDNGCEADKSETINQSADVPSVTISGAETLTCATKEITLTANVTGATNVSYVWKNSAGESLGSAQTQVITDPDTYTVLVTNTDNGCSAEASVTISENKVEPSATISADLTELTCTTTSITLTAQTNVADASYLWGNGKTTQAVSVSEAATYKVTITDNSNGCTAEATKEITQNIATPIIAIAQDKVQFTCDTLEIKLTASTTNATNPTYKWNDGTEGENLSIQSSSTYSVTVTDGYNGCSDSKNITIGEDKTIPNVSITPSVTVLDCANLSAKLTAIASDVSYLWSNADETDTTRVSSPGIYSVTVKSQLNGCSNRTEVEITQDISKPSVTISGAETLTCATTSVTLTANVTGATNVSYVWTKSDDTEMGSGQTQLITDPDTYKVVVTNTDNGCKAETSEGVNQNIVKPDLSISKSREKLTCDTLAITLTANASNVSYLWYDGTTNSETTISSPSKYYVDVTDLTNGCQNSDTINIEQDTEVPELTISKDYEQLTCDTLEITLTANASNVSYIWSDESTNRTTSADKTGTYTVNIKSLINGCSNTAGITITQDVAIPAVSLSSSDVLLTCGVDTISIIATADSVSYLWSTGETSDTIKVTAPGEYTVQVKSQINGCLNAGSLSISQDITTPQLSVKESLSACYPETIDISGALISTDAVAVKYFDDAQYSKELESTIADSLMSRYYYIEATGNNYCKTYDSVKVTINELTVELMPDTAVCYGETVELWIKGVGPETEQYSYAIISGGRELSGVKTDSIYTASVEVERKAVYYMRADNGTCRSVETVTISTIANPIIKIDDIENLSFSILQVSFGQSPYYYSVDNGEFATDSAYTVEDYGLHYVTVVDKNGCQSTYELTLVRPNPDIIIPPYFTPNGDGVNDVWKVKNIEYFKSSIIELYDRFGRLLHRFDETYEGWNGNYNGHPMPSDDYWYLIIHPDLGRRSGHITLKR